MNPNGMLIFLAVLFLPLGGCSALFSRLGMTFLCFGGYLGGCLSLFDRLGIVLRCSWAAEGTKKELGERPAMIKSGS